MIETRTTDKFVALSNRYGKANAVNADIFVSIHHNASGASGGQQGILTLYYDNSVATPQKPTPAHHGHKKHAENRRLARTIQNAMVSSARSVNPRVQNQGIRAQNLFGTRMTNMPSVMSELGFMDNYTEMKWLQNSNYQNSLVRGINNGINTHSVY